MTSGKKNKAGKAYKVFFLLCKLDQVARKRPKGGERVKSCENV